VAGCGSDNKTQSSAPATSPAPTPTQTQTTPAPAPKGGGTVTIGETEYKLIPAHATARAGAVSVVAKNTGTIVHTLEVEGNGVEKKTGDISPGSSATLKASLKPGTYKMYCTVSGHKGLGMKGTLVVH
jgi:plastocyanin